MEMCKTKKKAKWGGKEKEQKKKNAAQLLRNSRLPWNNGPALMSNLLLVEQWAE